ncbi:MAG: hypothetical protein KDA24_28795 [Deltaproteobacteria bacterium]|nr:hypothetical protein [Deltaproteobacteria bacterium]
MSDAEQVGSPEELCYDDDASSTSSNTVAELAYVPLICSQTSPTNPSFDPTVTSSPGGTSTSVAFLGMMADNNGGDDAQLDRYEVLLRRGRDGTRRGSTPSSLPSLEGSVTQALFAHLGPDSKG